MKTTFVPSPDAPLPGGSADRVSRRLAAFARFANAVIIVIPLLALIGWTFGIEVLKRVAPGLVEMNPMSAVNFILLGIALSFLRRNAPSKIATACWAFVGAFGAVMLCKYLFGWDAGIDRMLFRGSIGANRMAANTAANFLFISAAFGLFEWKTRRGHRPAECLALLTASIAFLAMVGYAYGVSRLYGVGRSIPMALHVAFCFVMLSLALLCARPGEGLSARLLSEAGGAMVRRLLKWIVAIPLLLGWGILAGTRAEMFDTAFGFTVFVIGVIAFVTAMIWKNAASLDRKDVERSRAEGELRTARDELELRVQERVADLAQVVVAIREAVALLSAAGRDIVNSTSRMASGTTQTATAITETTVTVEQLRHTAEVSSQQALAVAEGAGKTEAITNAGTTATQATERAMERIREQTEAVTERMAQMSEQTASIEDIIASVEDLSQQSKILSFNAAIEAAKAGDFGKGFVVVANEVKGLAAQSQQATNAVRAILKQIESAGAAAMTATEEARRAVEAGVAESAQAGDAIRKLAAHVAQSVTAARQISASSRQQSVAMDQVAEAIQHVKQASDENAASAVRLEAAALDLDALGQRLDGLTKRYQAG